MPQTEVPAKLVVQDYVCDKCGVGKMRSTGSVLMSSPAQYIHACDNPECAHRANFKVRYPHITYTPIDG